MRPTHQESALQTALKALSPSVRPSRPFVRPSMLFCNSNMGQRRSSKLYGTGVTVVKQESFFFLRINRAGQFRLICYLII